MEPGENNVPEIYLQPGEAHLARTPTILKTLLGSCVGVTLWNPRLRIGALCHGVLPASPPGVEEMEGYRYVDFAICRLLHRFGALGVLHHEIEVKIFGGADVLSVSFGAPRNASVGCQNSRAAMEVLQRERLQVVASDLGGCVGRTIQFHTGTGEVLLRRLAPLNAHNACGSSG